MIRAGVFFLLLLRTAGAQDAEPKQSADERPPLEIRVNRAVDRGCAQLLTKQDDNGGFGTGDKVHRIGRTSLTLLALLHGGVSIADPKVVRALDYLFTQLNSAQRTRAPGEEVYSFSTYETGITLMLLHDLPANPRNQTAIETLARYLVEKFDRGARMWAYPLGAPDLSNTQYALLGLRAAAQRGFKPTAYKDVLAQSLLGILSCQRKNGGFAYKPNEFSRSSMTVAALALIKFLGDELGDYGGASKDLARAKKAVKPAQDWLAENWSVDDLREGLARRPGGFYFYYMYGLERYAAFYGLKEIAGHRWYQDGAEALLAMQNDDGGFGTAIEDTCFAILFLQKATLTGPSERTGSADGDNAAVAPRKPPAPAPDAGIPFLREWLLLGPYAQTDDDDALVVDAIGETKVHPAGGKTAKGGKWVRYVAPSDEVDFAKALAPNGGVPLDKVAAYAGGYLVADRDGDARLWFDSDDGIRVFVNGTMVLEDHHHDGKNGMHVDVKLKKGQNLVLLKVENVGYYWHFKAQVTDIENHAIAGVGFTTRP